MSNQLSVLLPLVNEAGTYPSNLTIVGEIEGNPVHLMVNTGARVSAIKEEVLRENFGGAPYSVVQNATTTKKISYTLPSYLKNIQFPREFQVVHNLAYDAILGRDFL